MSATPPPTPQQWAVARALIEGRPASWVVTYLRLLLPCKVCGAAKLQPCRRGIGEVDGIHLTRGEE